jgi:hypothetical protein
MSTNMVHLSPEELNRCVVDEEALGGPSRDHLRQCPLCQRERRDLVRQLELVGESARQYAPEPVRKIVLPSRDGEVLKGWGMSWGLTFKLAAVAALLVLTFSWLMHFRPTPEIDQSQIASEMVKDETLMTEISMLEENSLPDSYQDISPETETDMDDDVFDDVVPVS